MTNDYEALAAHTPDSWPPEIVSALGRWAFAEFTDVYAIEAAFGRLVEDAMRAG